MDWLHQITSDSSQIAPRDLAMRLVGAWIAGCIIVLIYRVARRGAPATPALQPTLILLSILVAMVTQVIGDNTARAFSLVGALSIVRFRTAVEDTLDIAFVIFAVVVGMAIGANHWLVAGLGTLFVGTAAIAVRYRPAASNWFYGESTLQVFEVLPSNDGSDRVPSWTEQGLPRTLTDNRLHDGVPSFVVRDVRAVEDARA